MPTADAPTQRTLIVDGTGGVEGRYATLSAAIDGARSGDTIELHFDHPDKVEQPITIDKKELTIRAGSDPQRDGKPFQPVIVFRPTQDNVRKSQFAMITLREGHVKLEGIHVQMDLAGDVHADYWSMFEIYGKFQIRSKTRLLLSDCSLTIRNTPDTTRVPHAKVSFIDVRESSTGEAMASDGLEVSELTVPIHLARCIVRGEAVFLSAPKLQPLQLIWTQGLLATTEQFLVVGSGTTKNTYGYPIQIVLNQVTVLARKGVFDSANKRDEPHQLETHFNASHCIFIGDKSNPPHLIRQSGVGLATQPDHVADATPADKAAFRDFEMRMQWSGKRNIYQDFDFLAFWSIHSGEGDNTEELDRYDFSHWREARTVTELRSVRLPIIWKKSTPPTGRAVHSLAPADFLIAEQAAGNPAISPGKEENCGFIPAELPRLPQIVTIAASETPRPDQPPTGDDATVPKPSASVDR